MEKERFDALIDELCQHIDSSRIKLLIDNGYDEWELMVGITLDDLLEIGFTEEEAVRIQQTVKVVEQRNFAEEQQQSGSQASRRSLEEVNRQPQGELPRPAKATHKFEENPITAAWLLKGTNIKPTKPQEKFFSTLTMISLEEKKLTKICMLEDLSGLVMLHLGRNCLTKIEGLENLHHLTTLKLDNNFIQTIEQLDNLHSLTKLCLEHNEIDRLEGLRAQTSLLELSISDQRIAVPMTFESASMEAIGRSLEVFACNGNKVEDMTEFRHLKVLTTLEMKNNNLKEVSSIADVLSSMLRIKSMVFLGCPIVKAKKYRDYSVILAKSLEQLDGKKILPAERQYLVKLYSLKHAKQQRQQEQPLKAPSKKKENPEMNVNRITECVDSSGVQRLNSAADFHNNLAYVNSKKTPTSRKSQL